MDFDSDRYVQNILTIDNMAHRYKMLPSEVIDRATTFDLYAMDIAARYQSYQYDKANGNAPKSKMPSQEEMIAMIKRSREES